MGDCSELVVSVLEKEISMDNVLFSNFEETCDIATTLKTYATLTLTRTHEHLNNSNLCIKIHEHKYSFTSGALESLHIILEPSEESFIAVIEKHFNDLIHSKDTLQMYICMFRKPTHLYTITIAENKNIIAVVLDRNFRKFRIYLMHLCMSSVY